MPAIVIAAGVAAAAGVGSALISSSAAHSARDAATAAADKNNALQTSIYDSNKGMLSPYVQRGNSAGAAYNALLGLPSGNSMGVAPASSVGGGQPNPFMGSYGAAGGKMGVAMNDNGDGSYGAGTQGYGDPAPVPANDTTLTDARSAYNTFLGSDGYQFRMNEGMKGLNTGYAAHGLIQSGAAMKGINSFAQGTASDEFGKYMGYLGNQQATGLSAANGLAGVGTAYAGAVGSNNNSAAAATGNAALAGAAGTNAAIGNALNAFSLYSGMNSSYTKKAA